MAMLETGEQTLLERLLVSGSDSSELVPEAGRHEAFHLVCKESQGCKECAEELRGRWEREKKKTTKQN